MTTSDLNAQIAARTADAITEALTQLANGWTDHEVHAVMVDAWGVIADLKDQRDARVELGLDTIRQQLWDTACKQASPQHWTMRCYLGAGHDGGHLYTVRTGVAA